MSYSTIKIRIIIFFFCIVAITIDIHSQNLKDEYFGQRPPGDTPVKFAPDIISGYVHGRIAISPKGNEIFWVINPSTERIYYSKYENGRWSSPIIAPFIKNYSSTNNGNPTFTTQGEKLYFYSDMGGGMGNIDTWYTIKTDAGWSESINAGAPYNTENIDFSPQFTNTGYAYYFGYSSTHETVGLCYKYDDGIFSVPNSIEIIPEYGPWLSLFFSKDDDYIIFSKGENADLFIRFKDTESNWGIPVSLGDKINSNQWERFPVITPDKKYLFFTRGNSDISDLYWVSTNIIDSLRQEVTSIKSDKK